MRRNRDRVHSSWSRTQDAAPSVARSVSPGKGGGKGRSSSPTASRLGKGSSKGARARGTSNECFAWAAGECLRGNECKFNHTPVEKANSQLNKSSDLDSPDPRIKIDKPCFKWMKGSCTLGDACSYRHDVVAVPGKAAVGSSMELSRGDSPCPDQDEDF